MNIQTDAQGVLLLWEGQPVARALSQPDCEDCLTVLDDCHILWRRHAAQPTDHMTLRLRAERPMTHAMVPGVTYNGNDWGAKLDYVGFRDGEDGQPWRWAYHRAAIASGTYSEMADFCLALQPEGDFTDTSCSLYPEDGRAVHEVRYPEGEGPRVYFNKGDWRPAYERPMAPRQDFAVRITLRPLDRPRLGWQPWLSETWQRAYRQTPAAFSDAQLWDLGVTYAKSLYTQEPDGFCGFSIGYTWLDGAWRKRPTQKYEIGWCGQNASLAVSLLAQAHWTGDREARDMGLAVLDAWAADRLPGGLPKTHHDDNQYTQGHGKTVDACNLGAAAVQYFEAADWAERLGQPRPAYTETALDICDFAAAQTQPSGRIGKSWLEADLSPAVTEGTVGAFLTWALGEGARRTGRADYLWAACRSYAYYHGELARQGFTTAGALDIYCVDKESALPLLKAGLTLYDVTGESEYLAMARDAAAYLATWQWHYSRPYAPDSVCGKLGYDTFGGTLVSTTHQHQDPYALYYVEELRRLGALTGEAEWEQRADAIWKNGQQGVSDGTLRVLGKLRPAGSQDEGVMVTAWGWEPEGVSQWLVAWPTAFRLEVLRHGRLAGGGIQR
jgi:hypothetical protein